MPTINIPGVSVNAAPDAAPFDVIEYDNFDDGVLFETNPTYTPQSDKFLWNVYTGEGCAGVPSVSSQSALSGGYGLQVYTTAGELYMDHDCIMEDGDIAWGDNRMYAHEMIEGRNKGTWEYDKYNKLSMWFYIPQNVITYKADGRANLHLGTYFRGTAGDRTTWNADGGTHGYHYIDVESKPVWQHLILDMHPTHLVGETPTTEWGKTKEYPTNTAGRNYWDSLTRFYWNMFFLDSTPHPYTIYWDRFAFYEDTNQTAGNVNWDFVANIVASYNSSTNEIDIGWQNRKDASTNNLTHDVRYAFSSIHDLGWDNASVAGTAVGGTVDKVYGHMRFQTTSIDVSGQTSIFMAIKPTDETLFHEVEIPMNPATHWV